MERISKQAVLELLDKYKLNTKTGPILLREDINRLPSISDGWIGVETLPETNKSVMGLHKGMNGKLYHVIVKYTTGWDLEVDFDDDGDHLNLDKDDEVAYMPIGWYEECEQSGGSYDFMFIKRHIEFWQPLPPAPTK